MQPDRRGAVPDPSHRFGPGVKVPRAEQVPYLRRSRRRQWRHLQQGIGRAAREASGNSSGRVSLTVCRVRLLTGLTTTKGVPRG